MSKSNQIPGEKVESFLVASNFFLWTVMSDLTDSDNMFGYMLIATLISLVIILFSKPDRNIVFRKILGFFVVNTFGSIILVTNVNSRYELEEEMDAITSYFFLQIILVSLVIIPLVIYTYVSSKNEKKSSK